MSTSAAAVLSAVSKLDPTGLASKVMDIVTLIHGKYEQMKENKEICAELNKQVSIIGLVVKDLSKAKQIDYCRVTLDEVHGCLTNCLKVVDSIITVKKGFFSKVKDFLSSDSNKGLITKLTTQLHDMADILNLALTAQTSKNMQEMMKLMAQKQAEKLPEIQKSNKELEQNVDAFVKNMSQVINVSSNSSSAATANNSVNVVINSPIAHQSGRDSPPLETRFQHVEEEKRLYVLKRLKELFRDRDKGEKSKNFQTYNDVLENYGWGLGYKEGQHALYINDEAVSSTNILKEITKLITTIQSTMKSPAPQSSTAASPSPKASNQGDAKDKKDTKEKIEPMVTAFNQLKLTANPASVNTSLQTSSIELMNMDFKGMLALANQGHAMAQYKLGECYQNGENGCVKNDTKALEWYQKSVAQGNGCAQYGLGEMYQEGLGGLKKDPAQALKLYQDARESFVQLEGDVFVQNNLGHMYQTGQGVTKDLKKAAEWYQKAADQGYAVAQSNLGLMYLDGQGVIKDLKKAAEWIQKAANQGNVNAQCSLGFMYKKGEGVPKDLKQAAEWFQKAADQGDVEAQSNLNAMPAKFKPRK